MRKFNNLEYLQKQFEQLLEIWLVSDTTDNRISLFNVFNKLVIEISKVEFGVVGEKCYNYAFHYSLDLLDEFLNNNTYQKGLTGIEITEYVKATMVQYFKDQKHVVEEDIFNGFEVFKNQNLPEEEMLNYEIFSEINDLLSLFFTEIEIKQYLPLATSIISSGNHSKIVNLNDQRFKYFCMLLISLGKKLSRYYQKDVSSLNHSVNELTILIAGLSATKLPRELALSCDLSSIERLVEFAGGQEIKIPTRDELEDAYNEVKSSIRYPSVEAKARPLEDNFGIGEKQSLSDDTCDLFCTWLKENKKGLSQDKLDKILKILSE